MSKISVVPANGGTNQHVSITGDALLSEKFDPKTGVRLSIGVPYYFPDLQDFNEGRGFYKEQPEGFDDAFYGIYLLCNGITTSVPLGTFFRDRTSVAGKVADFDGNLRLIVKPSGFIADIIRNGIGGSLKSLADAICSSGFVGFCVTRAIEVSTRKYGTDNEVAPREVYEFEGITA